MRQLSVALLNPYFWPEVRRGSERFIRDLADGLNRHGHRSRLITSHRGRPRLDVEDGLEVQRNPRPPGRPLVWAGYHEPLTHLPFAHRSLHKSDFDVANAFYPSDAWIAARWSRRTGRPAVFSVMGIPSPETLARAPRLRRALWNKGLDESAAVVALSQAAAEPLRSMGIDARVIHPGVDTSLFAPRGHGAEAPTIFCAAAVDEARKRVPLLIEAFRELRRSRPTARLVLDSRRGRGTDRFEDLPEGVEFADVDDSVALVRAYSDAWLSVLPSREEAFGLVLLEALACGTPVVGANEGGIPEIVTSERIGRLFDGDDPVMLAGVIDEALELARDPATSDACRARAADFPVERCVESYEALYAELVDSRAT